MELIDNKQVKIVVPIDVAKVIQERIEKVEVLKTEKNLVHLIGSLLDQEMIIF